MSNQRLHQLLACGGLLVALVLAPATQAATIRSIATNNFVTATDSGTSFLMATAPAAGPAEDFEIIYNSDGTVSFRSTLSGKYVCADISLIAPDNDRLIANRTVADKWEKFWIEPQANGTVAIRSVVNDLYVSADLDFGGALYANRTSILSWEQFTIDDSVSGN